MKNSIWWGPPKKFSTIIEERKVSWLELFYDLVYVIVISRITHYLAQNPGLEGLMDYGLLFIMIFWGWLNGSLYYDLHGTLGIRTRLMMLWQMMAVAALAVALNSSATLFGTKIISALIFLQLYITYLWWSVGIYDKNHRKLNVPYTVSYLAALALIVSTQFIPPHYIKVVFGVSLLFNFLPSFLSPLWAGKKNSNLTLSSGMVERLGLLIIIVFGEAILGVINGTGAVSGMDIYLWLCFGLGILVVFSLWWIFFALIADREVKRGLIKGQTITVLYIPALASLGIAGATFSGLIDSIDVHEVHPHLVAIKILFGTSLSVFLLSICAISRYLQYPKEYEGAHRILVPLIVSVSILIILETIYFNTLPLWLYLSFIFCALAAIIVTITRLWFKVEIKRLESKN